MIKEKSCGAVLYKLEDDKVYYLLEFMKLGHVSLVKGHVEGNETEEETALREIKEETSLDVILDTNFREKITYSPFEGIVKDVIFFIGKVISSSSPEDKHDEEVNESQYFNFEDAYNKLTYQSDKDVLKKANEYLKATKIIK